MKTPLDEFGIDILAFAPHPDDAEICCGGLLMKMANTGYRSGIIDFTRGEMSSRGDLATRADETGNASKILKLHLRENLEFPDGHVGVQSSHSTVEMQLQKVVATFRRLRPQILLIPYQHERHPDHIMTNELLLKAVFFAGVRKFADGTKSPEPFTPRQVLFYQMRYQFRPSFIVDISDVAVQKAAAIRCYRSQLGLDDPSPSSGNSQGTQTVKTLLSSELTLDTFDARDRYYGAMIGASHGEPYLTRNIIAIKDPIEHFRTNFSAESLLFPEVL